MNQFLKAYCYLQNQAADEPLECSEVTLQAHPDILREVAKFLMDSAAKMEGSPNGDMHFHLQDEWKKWSQEFPDIIVASPT